MTIYLDYQATTPVDPEVQAAMAPYMAAHFANPHSSHASGRVAKAAVEAARAEVAGLICAPDDRLIFTSGATESNNLAIKGLVLASPPARRRIVTVATEHSCVLESARYMATLGAPLSILPVMANGLIDMATLDAALGEDVALVSVMGVNNEIGVIQPIREIARRAHHVGARMHVDAAQAFGKLPIDVTADGIDLLSISGHKIYGPKGIGALYVRDGVELVPLMHGGGQEGAGLRSGTLAPALCAGLGAAARIAGQRMADDHAHIEAMWTRLVERLDPTAIVNGDTDQRWRGNINIRFDGIDGTRLVKALRGIDISSGAACAAQAGRLSHVLGALGLDKRAVTGSLRIGWGRFSTASDVDMAADRINAAVADLRARAA